MPKDIRLLRIAALDPTKMLAWARTVGNGDRGYFLDRGLLLSLGHVEAGQLVCVEFNSLDEPIAVCKARTK